MPKIDFTQDYYNEVGLSPLVSEGEIRKQRGKLGMSKLRSLSVSVLRESTNLTHLNSFGIPPG